MRESVLLLYSCPLRFKRKEACMSVDIEIDLRVQT